MTDDDPFEQFLKDAAADYGAPRGEVPREAMWEAIRAQRAMASTTPARPARAGRYLHGPWLWVGLAATLVLGVAIGRLGWQQAVPTVAVVPQPAHTAVPDATPPAPDSPARSVGLTASTPAAPRHVPDAGTIAGAGSTTYSLVAARHLADVEALLSSFAAASPADARADSALAAWAKDLLSNTRLLLDSPAARDPVRARLLSDLEVILVQLVQRSPGGDAEAHASVERTIDKTQIIPRLRRAAPAGLRSGAD